MKAVKSCDGLSISNGALTTGQLSVLREDRSGDAPEVFFELLSELLIEILISYVIFHGILEIVDVFFSCTKAANDAGCRC
jgi:hypothetical protein